MILGGNDREADGNRTTLDDLFRRAGVRHPDAIALCDPPNRDSFTGGAPRRLTFGEADRAISAFAARLRGFGLQADTVVALQLPNTVESIIALLGVLRAGMIAVPLPLLWRQHDMVAALRNIGAKAIVTAARIGAVAHAELATQVAAELFPVRFICGFGRDLPDGVVPLDDIFSAGASDFVAPPPRPGNAAAHVAVVTFDVGGDNVVPVARNHIELIAGGLGPFRETGATPDAPILSPIPLGSFAGVAVTLMPWLLGGGTLHLHHAFDPAVLAAQSHDQIGGSIVLPGPALMPLAEAGHLDLTSKTIVALWRSPGRLAGTASWLGDAALVDVASFGEAGLIAARRDDDGKPAAIACGPIGAAPVIETSRTAAGTVGLRGAMVPGHGFPRAAEPHLAADLEGFVDTGFACRLERDRLVVTAPPSSIISVGGYRFLKAHIDAVVESAHPMQPLSLCRTPCSTAAWAAMPQTMPRQRDNCRDKASIR